MRYVEAPKEWRGKGKSLFLAGGITNCPNWQVELTGMLNGEDIVILNPRGRYFQTHSQNACQEQIRWEYRHLRRASGISFWFPKESLCPIALYELGTWSMTGKPIFVGVHPQYQRKLDVKVQTALVRPDVKIAYDLAALSKQIKKWIVNTGQTC